jgi:hypothetical protein
MGGSWEEGGGGEGLSVLYFGKHAIAKIYIYNNFFIINKLNK